MNKKELLARVQTLKDLTEVQCSDGNWNYDPYMHGMANGMIFALNLFEGGEPQYMEAPKAWLKDSPDSHILTYQSGVDDKVNQE